MMQVDYEALDPGIREYVRILNEAGIDTHESCEGGPGHCWERPTITFRHDPGAVWQAYAIAKRRGWPVMSLQQVWSEIEHSLNGPTWELVLREVGDGKA